MNSNEKKELASGPDGIYPITIQQAETFISKQLIGFYKQCLFLGYIPQKSRFSEVIFIPGASKKSPTSGKDLRLIQLSFFMLKIMEILLDLHTRQIIDRSH